MTATRNGRVLAVLAGAFPSLDTAVNIAFPAIDEHFGLDVADLQWVVVCYLLTYGGLLVGAGRLGDSIGHRRLVLWGGLISVAGLAGCAAAATYGGFLIARVVQGVGTAAVLAGAPALLTTSTPDGEGRGRAVSWFQAAAMAGFAVGPVIGGPLVAAAGWRAVFWFRVPIALLLVVLALRSASPGGERPGSAAAGFLRARLLQPGLARIHVLNVIANASIFAIWLLVPSLLVDEIGVAVVVGGLVLAVSPAMSAVGSLGVGSRIDRSQPARFARLGLAIQAIGLGAVAIFGPRQSIPGLVVALALVGVGYGTFSVPNMHQLMSRLPTRAQGAAGGLSLMMRTVGVVVGVTAASALFDPIERSDGFGPALRIVFIASAALAAMGALLAKIGV